MSIKTYKPITPTLRYKTVLVRELVTTDKPYKPLVMSKNNTGGRNSDGRTTSRFRGGGHKRKYRLIDFKQDKFDIPGLVETIEYDPNRTANIALVKYSDGERRYVLATVNLSVGQKVVTSENAEPIEGNRLLLRNIPLGYDVCNLEMKPGKGGQIAKSAGSFAKVIAKDEGFVQVKLPSSEIRNFPDVIFATIGQVSNIEHANEVIGSAGRMRWKGRRPHNRGVSMNPVDHPMGGGEGKQSGGHPRSPWGQKAKGLKTRKKKLLSDKYIVNRRKK